MEIKEKLKRYFEKRKNMSTLKRFDKYLCQQKKWAKMLLNKFDFQINFFVVDKQIVKEIDDHNFEYCFFPEAWRSLREYQKIAIIVKFTQKYCKEFPLSVDDFCVKVPESEEFFTKLYGKIWKEHKIEQKPELPKYFGSYLPFVIYDDVKNRVYANYNSPDFLNGFDILEDLIKYVDEIKQEKFLNLVGKEISISNFKNIEQLRYLLKDQKEQYLSNFPAIKQSNMKKYKIEAAFQNELPQKRLSIKYGMKMADILYNVACFCPEYISMAKNEYEYYNSLAENGVKDAKECFGDELARQKALLKTVYEAYFKDQIDHKEFEDKFLNGKKYKLEDDIFYNIKIATNEAELEK